MELKDDCGRISNSEQVVHYLGSGRLQRVSSKGIPGARNEDAKVANTVQHGKGHRKTTMVLKVCTPCRGEWATQVLSRRQTGAKYSRTGEPDHLSLQELALIFAPRRYKSGIFGNLFNCDQPNEKSFSG